MVVRGWEFVVSVADAIGFNSEAKNSAAELEVGDWRFEEVRRGRRRYQADHDGEGSWNRATLTWLSAHNGDSDAFPESMEIRDARV